MPPAIFRQVQPFRQLADIRLAVVGIFSLRIGVMNDHSESCPSARRSPLQHLKVAVGIAKGGDRASADVLLDTHGFAGSVVDEVQFWQAQ